MKITDKGKDRGVTIWAVLIGLLLIPINNLWITIIEVRWFALDGTCLPIFVTPIFILFMLVMLNALFRRITGLGLKRGELLTVYIMVVTAATLASHDLIQNLFGAIGHPHWMANDSNKYATNFFRYLPSHLFVSDGVTIVGGKDAVLTGFYKGGVSPWLYIKYWIGPLAWWGGLLTTLMGMMLCMNIIIRKQWTENEKLVFPLIQLPLAMTGDDSKKFYTNKFMWAGFFLAFLIGLINGLHVLYPSTPFLTAIKQYNIGQYFTPSPWNAVNQYRDFNISAYPFAIGLAYFMPLDLSFSCWFFYIVRKLVQVIGVAMGMEAAGNGFPYWGEQSSGAWIGLGIMIVIASYPYLRGVWRQAWNSEKMSPEDEREAKLYRSAFIGLMVGTLLIFFFTQYMGMRPLLALLFFGIYFILAIAITRVRAELGTPHEIYFVHPQQVMLSVFGYDFIGAANMTLISSMYWFNRCYRSHPMPNQLEAFKMAEGTAIKLRPLIVAIVLASIVGLISAYWANLTVTYHAGAQAKCLGFKWWVGAESFDQLGNTINNRPQPEAIKIAYMIVGFLMVVLLRSVRGAFIGWPFHPAGYALAISFAMDYFWFAFFLSWLIKLIIVRYGGMKLHNTFIPFFLGLILGDFFIGSIWAILGPLIGQQAYKIFI